MAIAKNARNWSPYILNLLSLGYTDLTEGGHMKNLFNHWILVLAHDTGNDNTSWTPLWIYREAFEKEKQPGTTGSQT